jgi:FkbM family methyltransferase
MPTTREEHISYTRSELETYPYYKEIIENLKEEKITSYIDIGANVGEFCNVLFEKIDTLKKAYLIEPQKDNFIFLQDNVKKEEVLFFQKAIGYNLISSKIYSVDNNIGGFRLVPDPNISGEEVEVITLEELNLPIVDLIKLDIEGGEYNVIENSTFLKTAKWIEIEFHDYHNIPTKEYVSKQFPDYNIRCIESLEGRCLLEKI